MNNNITKTTVQSEALQTKAQALFQTLSKKVIIITKGEQHIKVEPGYAYELSIKDGDVLKTDFGLIAKKVGSDLEVLLLENDTIVIFDNYFEVCTPDLSCLVSLPGKEGAYYVVEIYHVVENNFVTLADGSQIVYFYGNETELLAITNNQSNLFAQSFSDVYFTDIASPLKITEGEGGGLLSNPLLTIPLLGVAGAGEGSRSIPSGGTCETVNTNNDTTTKKIINHDDAITVTIAANSFQDRAGNPNASFTHTLTIGTTLSVQDITIDCNQITLNYAETLTSNGITTDDYEIYVGRETSPRTISSINVNGSNIDIVFDGAVAADDVYSVKYIDNGHITNDMGTKSRAFDAIIGNDNANILTSNDNASLMIAGGGNDTIQGGGGNDTLVGGAGKDIFIYDTINNSNDIITHTYDVPELVTGFAKKDFSITNGTIISIDVINPDNDGFAIEWKAKFKPDANDVIVDFKIGTDTDADVLDLADLLSFNQGDVIGDFMSKTINTDGDIVLNIDANGDGSGTDVKITLMGITGIDLDTMVNDGNILIM